MNKKRDLSFRVEVMIMLAVFIVVISVLTRLFALAETESRKARHLSDAVILAANGAEVFMAAEDDEEIYAILNEAGNAAGPLAFSYSAQREPQAEGPFCLQLQTSEKDGFREALLQVSYEGETIYELTTGRVSGGGQ